MSVLNKSANLLAQDFLQNTTRYRCEVATFPRMTLIDCGAHTLGSLAAGLQLARICLGGAAEVTLQSSELGHGIAVYSDAPLAACLGSQYAGWQMSYGKYFAMASGPMRAILAEETIFEEYPHLVEQSPVAVGALETRKLPTEEVCQAILAELPDTVEQCVLAVAPAASIAGNIQVVARCLETALHKLHALNFPLDTIVSGIGWAPLPPVAKDEISAIGRTNDAILYGGKVDLYVQAKEKDQAAQLDELIAEIGPRVPAGSSPDYGRPFVEIFQRYNGNFYELDPLLFSPAQISFNNLHTGRVSSFGERNGAVLQRSFASE
ncbi:MAG: methenyltetrahydromethanopterin cyclohydrolase [Zavarzinella sp.]